MHLTEKQLRRSELDAFQPPEPDDDDLCDECDGFGTVRCSICFGAGVLDARESNVQCRACKGKKRLRCITCGGSGARVAQNSIKRTNPPP